MNSLEGIGSTKKDYLDQARSQQVRDGEKQFNQLLMKKGRAVSHALAIVKTFQKTIREDPDISGLEEKLQGVFGEEFHLSGETPLDKFETALGFFYGALNFIDKKSKDTYDVSTFQTAYFETKRFVDRQIAPNYESEDQRRLAKIIKLIDNRLKKITANFNEKLEQGTVQGNRIY